MSDATGILNAIEQEDTLTCSFRISTMVSFMVDKRIIFHTITLKSPGMPGTQHPA